MTLVLEDSVAGLHAAKSAGAFAVGVPHRFSPAANMPHADLIIDRLDSPLLIEMLF
jgi:beta-phosphoglucomutase-like phosphatase (HAD superfamily)